MPQKRCCRNALIAALLSLIVGCGARLPPPADPKVGEEVFCAALEKWKEGVSVESLRVRKPPVWFNDPEWLAETRLLSFELVEPVTHYGRQLRCTVKLSLQKKQGAPFEKRIGYQIETTPNIVIAREGM